MKHKLLRLSLLSMLVMFFGGLAFADQVTMKYSGTETSNMTGENDAALLGLDADAWSVIGAKGAASNMPGLNKAGDIRLYYNANGSNTITVKSLANEKINRIAITFTSDSYSKVSVTVDGSAIVGNEGVYDINSTSFVLGNGNTTNVQVRIKEIVITYGETGTVDTRIATSMTIGDHQTTGIVNYSMDVPEATVRDASGAPVNGAYIDWRSSDDTVAGIADGNIGFLKPGTTTITASFAGDNQYKPCSASFTLTVTPEPYTSIAAMLADITSTKTTVSYRFENLLVTYVNGSNTFVSDGKDGFLFYGKDLNLVEGYTYSGTATGQLYAYNGLPEMALTADGLSVQMQTEGNQIDYTTITPADMPNYINKPIVIEKATFVGAGTGKNLVFKVGDEDLAVYNQWSINVESLVADQVYDLTGFGSIYAKGETTTYQLYLISFEEKAEEQWTWRDFAVNLTDANIFDTSVNNFGVKVAEDGTYTATTADDETANVIVNSARFNDGQHGWVNCTFTMKVNGPVLIKLGDCQFGAQTGTITDAENNVTELTKPAKQCWDKNNPDQNVVATYYRGLTPTTLTIKYDGYCPFISVTAIDPNDLPAEVTKYTVTFDAANSGAEGVAPDAITEDAGTEITIPQNYTLYKEGQTLTCWRDATGQPYAPGDKFTLQADMTLLPEFSQNEVSLADRTEPVTVKWNFRRDQGAPAVGWEGKAGLVWVAQATVNGKTIDVALPFSTNPGKFNNKSNTDWVQINNGTTFTVPSCKDATISMEAYNVITTTTIDGQSDYTQGKTISYTIAGSAETVDVVIGDGSYYRYIQVVLPKVEKQTAGMSFDNVEGTISWQVGNEESGTVTDEIADAVQSALWTAGSEMTITTSTYFESTMVNYKPNNSNAGNVEGVMIEYRVKLAPGLTFTPTSASYDCVKVGTDGATYSWGYAVDDNASDITEVNAATTLRNNGSNSSTAQLNHTLDLANAGEGNVFALRFYISKTANNKNICIGNVKINGVVNGTIQDVVTYTFAAVVSPEEAGSVNVYPSGDTFEAGTELTLTATENFGYDFVNWTNAAGEEVSTDAKFVYTVESNETLTANFVAVETYELALTVDGTNDYMVTVEPAPTMVDGKMMYEAGQAVQLTANQYEDLVTFTNWSDGDTNSSKLVSMTEDIKLTAMYAEADIIAGWDFYTAGGSGRKADFAAQDNDGDALNLVNTETGETSGWLDKSWLAAGGYESFKGAAVNWRTGTSNGDVGNWHWQTKVNAEAFTDIKVQFQMLYNYNAYQTYNAEYSLDGENWTQFGTINMTGAKKVASFNKLMPADANNQAELYIRMIADKTSNVDGAASANDGNTLAMFFITGTPKLVDDGVAPVLVSTVPADGATGASATGKIVLTFDERVKLADTFMPTATLGNQTLTPAVSGKTVTFEYKGLEYSTEYTFTLPGGSIADLTNNFIQDAITLTFTTMVRPSVEKGLYDYVVENVDDLLAAISGAESRSDKNTRYRIFIKNGEYTIPVKANILVAKAEGNEVPECITFLNASNVSFIGESRDGVIITNGIDKNATFSGQYGITSKYDGIGNSDVFQIGSRVSGLYWQDLTVETGMDDATGRDLAIQDKGTKNIYKNVGLRGYQDTWTSNNDNGLYYFEGGYVRGRTDYMCGKGDIFWNGVELRQIAGGYAAVPSKPAKYGWIYKDCVINGEGAIVNYADQTYRSASQVDNNYTLGRPWGSGTPIALFIDTRMNVVPSAIGWNEMSNGWPARFAEYNSTTSTGSVIDLSGRKKTFGDGHANNPVLTAEEALENSDLHRMYGDWDPTLATEQAPIPTNVRQEADSLKWDNSNYALLWAIVKDGNVVGFTVEPAFQLTEPGAYAVRAANEMGGLSEASAVVEVKTITTGIFETPNPLNQVPETIYNINGIRVQKAQHGLYIINGRKVVIK